jgi:hydrogenase nickel incorporation protein HypA/HybF
MHERVLFEDLMSRITRLAEDEGAARVIGIKVRLGRLSHLTPEHFLEHFEDASRGTVAEGARVEIGELEDLDDPYAMSVVLDSVEIESQGGFPAGRRG